MIGFRAVLNGNELSFRHGKPFAVSRFPAVYPYVNLLSLSRERQRVLLAYPNAKQKKKQEQSDFSLGLSFMPQVAAVQSMLSLKSVEQMHYESTGHGSKLAGSESCHAYCHLWPFCCCTLKQDSHLTSKAGVDKEGKYGCER